MGYSTLFSDNFNRSNGTPGSNWSVTAGTWAIASNQLRLSSGGGPARIRNPGTAYAGTADQRVTVKVNKGAGFDGGPWARVSTSADTGYYLDVYQAGGEAYIIRRVSGTDNPTPIVTVSNSHSAGDTYGIEILGTGATVTCKIWKNGSVIATGTDTSGSRITDAGQGGLLAWDASNYDFDDFLVESWTEDTEVTGALAATLDVTGNGSGTHGVSGTAAATLDITGDGTGEHIPFIGTLGATLVIIGDGQGEHEAPADAVVGELAATLSISADITGTFATPIVGAWASTLVITGSGTGFHPRDELPEPVNPQPVTGRMSAGPVTGSASNARTVGRASSASITT